MARGPLLCDTSAAVALVVRGHEHHEAVRAAAGRGRLGLAGHAAFETFSVLTRLPPPLRRAPRRVLELLRADFPETRFLGAAAAQRLLGELPAFRLGGGAVYDALVGAAAVEHALPLLTRDLRAVPVYRALGVEVRVVD
jgi:predicted nucleic acid-binding protein